MVMPYRRNSIIGYKEKSAGYRIEDPAEANPSGEVPEGK
jgi:hypothetical protein